MDLTPSIDLASEEPKPELRERLERRERTVSAELKPESRQLVHSWAVALEAVDDPVSWGAVLRDNLEMDPNNQL